MLADYRGAAPEAFYYDCECVRDPGVTVDGEHVVETYCVRWEPPLLRTDLWDDMEARVRWNGREFEQYAEDAAGWVPMRRCAGDCPEAERLRAMSCPSRDECAYYLEGGGLWHGEEK